MTLPKHKPSMIVKSTNASRDDREVRVVGAQAGSKTFTLYSQGHPAERKSKTAADQPSREELLLAQQVATQRQVEQTLENIWDAVEQQVQYRRQALDELQFLAIELGTAIAGCICQQKIDANDFPLKAIIDQLLERLGFHRPITVCLHAADLPEIQKAFADHPSAADLNFAIDPTLHRGECRADNMENGFIATTELNLIEIRQMLMEGIDSAQAERRQNEAANSGVRRFPDRRTAD
jgi:hypothetical protein